jgi:hypothetical protein
MTNQDEQQGQEHGGETGRVSGGPDSERQRDIAAEGGRSVPDDKRTFAQDGGLASGPEPKGGEASAGNRPATTDDQNADRQPGDTALASSANRGTETDDVEGGGRQGGSGNFANDPARAAEAGRKGGQN